MIDSFDQQLAKVQGKLIRVYMDDHQHRMKHGLLYYFNKADELRKCTEILLAQGAPREPATMLGGMALEVLLKGIAVGLDSPTKRIHNLSVLADHIGVSLSDDERILVDVMSEHVFWAGRYTAPRKSVDWIRAWELRDKQTRRGGSLAEMEIPTRTFSIGNFRSLWAKFSNCFWKVKEARLESAEFSFEQRFCSE
jgi:hypothetical protein